MIKRAGVWGMASQGSVFGYLLKERIGLVVVIDVATVVLESVADDEVINLHHDVVAANLVENLLRDIDVGSFVFDNHARLKLLIVKNGVASARHTIEKELHFVGHERRWVTHVLREEVGEVLPDPFLWSESHKLVAQRVEYLCSSFSVSCLRCV